MQAPLKVYPFRQRSLDSDSVLAVSLSGDYALLTRQEAVWLSKTPDQLSMERLAELQSKFFLGKPDARGFNRLLASRRITKQETVRNGPSLHILVTTLQCGHSCRYCQVSRSLDAEGYSMSPSALDAACDTIFESPSPTLTIEFQGGDPLLRFDLIVRAVERIEERNRAERRQIRYVVASTLHQLNEDMCSFLKRHQVYLSTSIDGPAPLHNRNRPIPSFDSLARTVAGIELARRLISPGAVSALMTTTRDSLAFPEAIVDEYVKLGFEEIFVRPLSLYGFALRNQHRLGYSTEEFLSFYLRALDRVLYWNRKGRVLREVLASIVLNKILSPFDAGYVDLQSAPSAGLAVLVYNYDGYVYPSDEARMLAETGDCSFRLGRIGDPINKLLRSEVMSGLAKETSDDNEDCRQCVYAPYCGPDPIAASAECGSISVRATLTEHCRRYMALFDLMFGKLKQEDPWFESLAHQWARPLNCVRSDA